MGSGIHWSMPQHICIKLMFLSTEWSPMNQCMPDPIATASTPLPNIITYGHDHNLAFGHEHAPAYDHANTIYGHDHIGSAKAGWVRVAGHTKPSSADECQVYVVSKFYVLDEKVLLPFYHEAVRQSRKEVGCIAYELFKNADEKASDNYALFEIWRTSEDYERHMRTPHTQAAIALIRAGKGGLDQSKGRDGVV